MTRGEVWLVAFDPAVGQEIRKTRPAVIVSSDAAGVLSLRVVVPITGWQAEFSGAPWLVPLEPSTENGLSKRSAADTFQVKSVSTRRLAKRLGVLADQDLQAVIRALGIVIEHP